MKFKTEIVEWFILTGLIIITIVAFLVMTAGANGTNLTILEMQGALTNGLLLLLIGSIFAVNIILLRIYSVLNNERR